MFLGAVATVYGVAIVIMDLWFKRQISEYFGQDILQDAEDFYPEEKKGEDHDMTGEISIIGKTNNFTVNCF